MATRDNSSQTDDENWTIPSVAPDAMCLDGHVFRINYDVPEEITRQLNALYDRDAKYEEIPEHLRAYEIEKEDSDVEEAKELERYLEEEAKRKKKDLEEMKEALLKAKSTRVSTRE
ncbi:hypothetical protein CNMCM6936_001767 [Aspergillus lentulus]|uniref:Uncharacterized protein n=1 Tax=Aspergillus lentulus TaxID=293939 RepID=A0AAN5YH99_ASPLE|nr:hypothetical protein CNMCM6936_001767 [Aspergillus lentulus]KAF4171577.1 hypothetical protein CNMCM8060_002687 [Aspergillus lentulus]KAF4179570.1 hypothetical protein CNMCM7927_001819 [Aspergillus lentulus]KAF4194023.1 hypothetical protein CNMCM8694_008068 [Aspergillus lentulus]KAF4201234.1 hypothetical protein CNMCM8927_001882 [Aspergillus lentulus]